MAPDTRVDRRTAIQSALATVGALGFMGSAFAGQGAVSGSTAAAPRGTTGARKGKLGKLQILQVGVGGSIAPADRAELVKHPDVVFTGLCDVDSNALAEVSKEFPGAFTCQDFREAFAKHGDKFDAVVVCTPDHNHAVVMLTALKAGKHVYGQKPLVQQLSEVVAMQRALRACPAQVTQTGNQRMGYVGRQAAVDILRRGLLGKAVEAHVWVDGPPDEGNGYFYYGGLKEPSPVPAHINWPLWLGAAQDAPHREGLVSQRWRSSWDYGTGQLGDWCTHLLDVLYFAYDLPSPISVVSYTRTPSDFYHALCVQSTLAYPGGGKHFSNAQFPVHYCDRGQAPNRAALGIPPGKFGGTGTLVVCQDGVLFIEPEGNMEIWRGGKPVEWQKLSGIGQYTARNHWHSWVDKILGKPDAFVQTPFSAGAGMSEAGLLCAKAARYPGQELLWDPAGLRFSNHVEASNTIVRRDYRTGFQLPEFTQA